MVVTINDPGGAYGVELLNAATKSLGSANGSNLAVNGGCRDRSSSRTFTYQAAASGAYFVHLYFYDTGMSYTLTVTAQGTPIAVPNPPIASCLTGPVNYITYSLQYIAIGLADEISVGGVKVNASTTVKPPLYPEIVSRLENALRSKVNVEACYDSGGNIFQIKLVQP